MSDYIVPQTTAGQPATVTITAVAGRVDVAVMLGRIAAELARIADALDRLEARQPDAAAWAKEQKPLPL